MATPPDTTTGRSPADDGANRSVRVDLWLWAVRFFKTRKLAAEACRSGHVTFNQGEVKPSRPVRIGDEIRVFKEDIESTLGVIGLTAKRVGAKRVGEFVENRTPAEEVERARQAREQRRQNDIFADVPGRPTKRDRRQWETFTKAIKP